VDAKSGSVVEMVRFVDILRDEVDPQTGRVDVPDWSPRYQYPVAALAWLHANEHPDNPFHGDGGILKMCVAMTRHLVSQQDDRGRFDGGGGSYGYVEWPAYYMIRACEFLGGALDAETRSLVERSVERYLAGVLPRPFFHTSFNHEAWRSLDAVAAGQCFGRADWLEQGLYLARQLCRIQNPAGYWHEGPHHGPSASYNYVMLGPLAMISYRTGDAVVRAAADRLREFMLRFVFPDGTTPGSFDGRQSMRLAAGAVDFSRCPRGRRLNRLAAGVAEKLELRDPLGPHYAMSNWGAHSQPAAAADRADYWSDDGGGEDVPLPQESDGYREVVEGDVFDGGVFRAHGWMAALSGYCSDVTRIGSSPYRLERNSRIDLWHPEFGIIVGGGSTGSAAKAPAANVHVVTGYGCGVDFGLVAEGDAWDRQGNYHPRAGRTEFPDGAGTGRLELHFGHGTCRFEVEPAGENSCAVRFRVDSRGLKAAYVQLPLVVVDGGAVSVGGATVAPAPDGAPAVPVPEESAVELTSPLAAPGKRASIVPPAGRECRLRPPVEPLRSYRGLSGAERYGPVFRIALLSAKLDAPGEREEGEFLIELR